MDGVDGDIVEAARGMGLQPFQVLVASRVPARAAAHLRGIRTAAVYVVATATLAGVVGGGSLGDIIFNQPTYFLSGVVGAAIVVSLLAFAADFIFARPAAVAHSARAPLRRNGAAAGARTAVRARGGGNVTVKQQGGRAA